MLFNLKKYLVLLICIIPAFSWGETQEEEGPKVLISYPLSKLNSNLYLYKELKTEKDLIPGSYRLTANIHLKTTLHPVEYASLDLTPKPSTGNMIFNRTINKEIKIEDFDELQIDYQDMVFDNPSLVSLQMILSGEKLEGQTATVLIKKKENQLVPSTLSDLDSSSWKKKEYSYIVKRWFQLPFDSHWRYIFKPHKIFFQKRFHRDFSSIESVDIVFKPDVSFEEINSLKCNLRFSYESKLQLSKIVECGKFPQRLIKTRGKLIRRISVGSQVRSQYTKNGAINLSEIIFIVPRSTINSIQKQPVKSIILQSLASKDSLEEERIKEGVNGKKKLNSVFNFFIYIEDPLGEHKRLILPLRQLTQRVGKNGKIQSLTLSVKPQDPKFPYEFHLNRLRAVSFNDEEWLSILHIGEKLNTRWGGSLFDLEKNDGKTESTEVSGYVSFRSLGMSKKTSLLAKKSPLTKNMGVAKQKKMTRIVNFAGTQIRTQNHFSNWRSDKNGLQLTGKGSWVEIDWPIQMKLDKNTRFLIGIDEMASDIDTIQAQPFIGEKALESTFLLPNKTKELKDLPGEIDGFKIRLNFPSNKFHIRLKEFAIIRPQRLSQDQMLDTPIFFDGETTLFPKNIQSFPTRKVDFASGHLGAPLFALKAGRNELSWETEVVNRVTWIQGLKIIYKMFPLIQLDNPCWLKFTLVTSKRQIEHVLCPDGSSDQIIIPRETLFKSVDLQANEMLENITWKIQAKTEKVPYPQYTRVDIGMKIIGQYSRSIRKELMRYPVIALNGRPFYAKTLNQVPAERILSGNLGINLGLVEINNRNTLKRINHPYFKVTNFALEKSDPLSIKNYKMLIKNLSKEIVSKQNKNLKKDTSRQTVSYLKVIFFFLCIVSIGYLVNHKDFLHRLQELLKLSSDTVQRQLLFFALTATVFYLLALFFCLVRWHLLEETFLSLAGLPILMATRVVIWRVHPYLESNWPTLASHVYRGPGTPYIAGFFLSITLSIFFLIFPVNVLAENIGVSSFYMLVVGVYLEVRSLCNKKEKVF